jgi:hypothetical protein
MTAIVAMFYSQRSRDVIIKKSEDWDNRNPLFMLLQIVLNRYVTTYKKDNYPKFSDNIFVDILRLLFNGKKFQGKFPYDPDNVSHKGFISVVYICKLYNLLGVDYKIFDIIDYSTVVYSYYNKEYAPFVSYNSECIEVIKKEVLLIKNIKNDTTPPILMIRLFIKTNVYENDTYKNVFKSIDNENTKKQLTSLEDKMCYNGKVYILDSVILRNSNDINGKHAIAGITCEGHKYIYNGWVRTAIDTAIPKDFKQRTPCELMPYDWNIKTGANFCLNNATCIPEIWRKDLTEDMKMKLMKTDLCFNFNEGSRTLIYVRQDTTCDDKDDVV